MGAVDIVGVTVVQGNWGTRILASSSQEGEECQQNRQPPGQRVDPIPPVRKYWLRTGRPSRTSCEEHNQSVANPVKLSWTLAPALNVRHMDFPNEIEFLIVVGGLPIAGEVARR